MSWLRWIAPVLICSSIGFSQSFPIRGIHIAAPAPDEIPLAERFIREALPKQGANTLVVEFNYHYQFASHPEIVDGPALSAEDVRRLLAACRSAGVRLVPMMNLLGHQSWRALPSPCFEPTPSSMRRRANIRTMRVRTAAVIVRCSPIFTRLSSISSTSSPPSPKPTHSMSAWTRYSSSATMLARGARAGTKPACSPAVRALHDHLTARRREMWMWGDRFLDGDVTGMGEWEASKNGTAAAIQSVPRDMMICDWHYRTAHPSSAYFALEGFNVVSAPWRDTSVALRQLDLLRLARANSAPLVAARFQGMLQTTWVSFGVFAKTWFGEETRNTAAIEAAATFRELFRELRK